MDQDDRIDIILKYFSQQSRIFQTIVLKTIGWILNTLPRFGRGCGVVRGVPNNFATGSPESVKQIAEAEENLFPTTRRPDGPVFGLIADSGGVSHILVPTFVRVRDDGWFFAYCYRCGRDERFGMNQRYFHPFTGQEIGLSFSEALKAGSEVGDE